MQQKTIMETVRPWLWALAAAATVLFLFGAAATATKAEALDPVTELLLRADTALAEADAGNLREIVDEVHAELDFIETLVANGAGSDIEEALIEQVRAEIAEVRAALMRAQQIVDAIGDAESALPKTVQPTL